ncbi:MAG: tetratricopeptide repeat protein [Acidobacteriota bacterium]
MFLEMARRLYQGQAFDLAVEALESARAIRADDPDLFFYLGHNYRKLKRLGPAQEALERALELGEDRPEIRLELGLVFFDQFRHGPAAEILQSVLADRPDLPQAEFYLAVIQYRMNRLDAAEFGLRRLLDRHPDYPEAAYYLGRVLFQKGELPAAAEWFEVEVARDPAHGPSRFNLAKLYRALGDEAMARRHEDQFQLLADAVAARARQIRQQAIHSNQGLIHYDRGEFPLAAEEFLAVLADRPDDPQMLTYLGSAYLGMEDLDRAEETLERARILRPQDGFTLTELGRVYALRGELKRAEEIWRETIRVNPFFSLPHYFLAGLYQSQNRMPESREAMQRYRMLESGQGNPQGPGVLP